LPIGAAMRATIRRGGLQDEDHIGFMSMIDSIMTQAGLHLERLDRRRREPVPSDLVVGGKCGSDAFRA